VVGRGTVVCEVPGLAGWAQRTVERVDAAVIASRRCWTTAIVLEGRQQTRCLRPGPAAGRPQAGRDRVFLHAYSVDGTDQGRGVFAAIVAEADAAGGWRVVARLPGLAVGAAGDCGCAGAALRRMGRERWGWVFAVREADTRSFRAIAALPSGLAELARVPVPEDGVDGLRHAVEFDLRDEQAEAYPLLHVILRGTRPVDVRRHPVDATSGRYAETPVPSGT
jgi:hypothetical protein